MVLIALPALMNRANTELAVHLVQLVQLGAEQSMRQQNFDHLDHAVAEMPVRLVDCSWRRLDF